jgi:hypothetical protein
MALHGVILWYEPASCLRVDKCLNKWLHICDHEPTPVDRPSGQSRSSANSSAKNRQVRDFSRIVRLVQANDKSYWEVETWQGS